MIERLFASKVTLTLIKSVTSLSELFDDEEEEEEELHDNFLPSTSPPGGPLKSWKLFFPLTFSSCSTLSLQFSDSLLSLSSGSEEEEFEEEEKLPLLSTEGAHEGRGGGGGGAPLLAGPVFSYRCMRSEGSS